MNAEPMAGARQTGMFDAIQSKMDVSGMVDKVRSSKDIIFESAIYLGIGFLAGFLLKKYNTYAVVVVLMLVGLGILNHMDIIHIAVDWSKLSSLLGVTISQPMTTDNMFPVMVEFVKANKVVSISGIAGFVIGLKMG